MNGFGCGVRLLGKTILSQGFFFLCSAVWLTELACRKLFIVSPKRNNIWAAIIIYCCWRRVPLKVTTEEKKKKRIESARDTRKWVLRDLSICVVNESRSWRHISVTSWLAKCAIKNIKRRVKCVFFRRRKARKSFFPLSRFSFIKK